MAPPLTALAQFFQGALLLDQLHLRLPKLCARRLQLRLRAQAWERRGWGGTSEISYQGDHRTRPRPQDRPLSPQVSQQLLQARNSSFKWPSTTVCSEAGKTPAQRRHAKSRTGTPETPFTTPGPAPGTLGYPPTYSQTREPLACTHHLLSAGPGA